MVLMGTGKSGSLRRPAKSLSNGQSSRERGLCSSDWMPSSHRPRGGDKGRGKRLSEEEAA